jgi:alkylation response protein AidB-like acyl-CoA dehydrogenase
VRFAFSEEQLAFRDATRELLAKECTTERVRDAWTNPDGRSGQWATLAAMGVVGLLAPEPDGGLGGDEVDLVLLLEESGRVALAEPLAETAAVVIPLLRDAGDARVRALAAGEASAAAVGPTDLLAPWADTAAVVVRCADDGVVAWDAHDVSLESRRSVDGARRLFRVEAPEGSGRRLGGPEVAALAADRGALATAAQLLGLADRMLATTVDYVRERHQFGVPVGSFQAVKHHLADARLALEFARPLVYHAAASVATHDPDRSTHASMAKVAANDAAQRCARASLQCHGAIGYTTEHDLHLFMKRTWALARSWGDTPSHLRRVARAIL